MKVLFLGCHCDDIELGCGATIHKHRNDWDMDALILSQETLNKESLIEIAKQNLFDLGINATTFFDFKPSHIIDEQLLWETLSKYTDYDTIFTQEPDDHQDHECLYKVTKRAYKSQSIITYCASVLSCPAFQPNYFEKVSAQDVESKCHALKNYHSVYADRKYMKNDLIIARMLVDGAISFDTYAEGFNIRRQIC